MSRFARPVLLVLGFLLPVLIVAGWRSFGAMQRMVQYPLYATPLVEFPEAEAPDGRPVAAILLSNRGTEAADLLLSYAILQASEAFDVVLVAPERRLSPVTGGLDVLPEHSFATFAQTYPDPPALFVVPFFLDANSPVLTGWLRAELKDDIPVLSLSEGARTLAVAGLLTDKRVTTHFWSLSSLAKNYPQTRWVAGTRYHEDGNLISSAGVTAAGEATFAAVRRHAGAAAEARARLALGAPEVPEVWPMPEISLSEIGILLLNGGFLTQPSSVAIIIADQVEDLHLAALLEIYPRSLTTEVITASAQRELVQSRAGLWLLARTGLKTLPAVDRIFIPGGAADTLPEDKILRSGPNATVSMEILADLPPADGFSWALADLAKREDQATATLVSDMIEAEPPVQIVGGRAWPWPRFLVMLAVGFAGVLGVAWLTRRP